MPPNSAENSSHKGPGHFLVRTSGEVVPLIPVDELPVGVDIVDVPRSLDLTDTVGMLNLGLVRSTNHIYEIEKKLDGVKEETTNKPHTAKAGIATTLPVEAKASITKVRASTPSKSASVKTMSIINSATPVPRGHRATTNIQRNETCRHWAAHGICKWGQQCRYHHIMPMTHQGLHEAGLSDWPAWYRALNPTFFHDHHNPIIPAGPRGDPYGSPDACVTGCCDPYLPPGLAMSRHAPGYGTGHSHGHGQRHHTHSTTKGALHSSRRFTTSVDRERRRREEPGEEVLERLRLHALSSKEAEKENKREKDRVQEIVRKAKEKKEANCRLERAVSKNAKAWEDSSSSDDEDGREAAKKSNPATPITGGKDKGNAETTRLVDV